MKKRSLKTLMLNKKSISNLSIPTEIKGGISGFHHLCSDSGCPSEETPSEANSELIICWGTTMLTFGNDTCEG